LLTQYVDLKAFSFFSISAFLLFLGFFLLFVLLSDELRKGGTFAASCGAITIVAILYGVIQGAIADYLSHIGFGLLTGAIVFAVKFPSKARAAAILWIVLLQRLFPSFLHDKIRDDINKIVSEMRKKKSDPPQ
jgi:hypothetical protein